MHRSTRLPATREALGKLLGKGPQTFYARFKRYKIPEWEKKLRGRSALLTTVTDQDLFLLTDHLWVNLPPSTRICSWALEPRTVLRIVAEVGEYATRRYDHKLLKSVGLVDYCFEVIFEYEPISSFPLITPLFERDCDLFFDKLLKKPELVKRWSGGLSVTSLPKSVLPPEIPLFS